MQQKNLRLINLINLFLEVRNSMEARYYPDPDAEYPALSPVV